MKARGPRFSFGSLWTSCLRTIRTPFRRRLELAPIIDNVRADKVDRIREALKTGTYNVRSEDVADKVIAHTILDALLTADTRGNTCDRATTPTMSRKRRHSAATKFYGLIEFLSLGFSRRSGNVHM